MLNLSAANLIGGFVFGSIGFVAFIYGKRMNLWRPMFGGLALMIYPYFVANTVILFIVGTIGSAARLPPRFYAILGIGNRSVHIGKGACTPSTFVMLGALQLSSRGTQMVESG